MSGKTSADYRSVYTKPDLRERLKEEIKRSSKGGSRGQWSARKSQLLTHEYEKQGGGYKTKGKRSSAQRSLKSWTDEKWQTQSGAARARHGRVTDRYLPKKAWDRLTPSEKRSTERKKREGSKAGHQFVSNTAAARAARGSTADGEQTKAELYQRATKLKIAGRSVMTKAQLAAAIRRHP